jgi:hypothetical protein
MKVRFLATIAVIAPHAEAAGAAQIPAARFAASCV